MEQASTYKHLGAILGIYLTGLLVGGLYVGMVAPVRTVVQLSFGLDDTSGIWMITIYTLFYAALIPVIGNIADHRGRKKVFVGCVAAFALGALLCGFSCIAGGFVLLLCGRVIQAIGACGMIPVANAEIGTSFPVEKRGMALGLAAAVSGLANVFGAVVGSALLALFGDQGWPWMFFISVPICVLLLICALKFLPNHAQESASRKLDVWGAVLFVVAIVLLLLSLRSVNFFDLATLMSFDVLLPFLGAVVCAVVFYFVERRAQEPLIHFENFRNRSIVVTCAISFFIGCMIISMTLIPEFAEYLLELPVGSGGYYVAALGIFSLAGPVIAGKIIDRVGPKIPLMGGLCVTALGFLFLALVVCAYPSAILLIVGLCIAGLGMGFSMGAPTNYMILESTPPEQSTTAIASITLIRQIGTTLSPALLVGIVSADSGVGGFSHMLVCVAGFCIISMVLLCFYKTKG